jgi:hypothetical protein
VQAVTFACVKRSCARIHCAGRDDECGPGLRASQSRTPGLPSPQTDSGVPQKRTQIVIHRLTAAHKLRDKAEVKLTKLGVYHHCTQLTSLSLSLFQFHNMFRPMQRPSSGVVSKE